MTALLRALCLALAVLFAAACVYATSAWFVLLSEFWQHVLRSVWMFALTMFCWAEFMRLGQKTSRTEESAMNNVAQTCVSCGHGSGGGAVVIYSEAFGDGPYHFWCYVTKAERAMRKSAAEIDKCMARWAVETTPQCRLEEER